MSKGNREKKKKMRNNNNNNKEMSVVYRKYDYEELFFFCLFYK
jgi:hypothetical protein